MFWYIDGIAVGMRIVDLSHSGILNVNLRPFYLSMRRRYSVRTQVGKWTAQDVYTLQSRQQSTFVASQEPELAPLVLDHLHPTKNTWYLAHTACVAQLYS